MEVKGNVEGYAQFAVILAPVLGEGFRKAGVDVGELTPTPSGSALTGTGVALPLRFEGALAGECIVALDEKSARGIAGEGGDAKQVLASALQAAAELVVAALFAHYGTVRVLLGEEELPAEDAAPAAWLSGATAEGIPIAIALFADGELARGLGRLARVRAAAEASGITGGNLGLVMDVELNVALRFGQRQLSLREVMDLTSGSVVELDREVDEPVELILDGKVIARGEAVIVDGNYGVRVTEVLHPVVF